MRPAPGEDQVLVADGVTEERRFGINTAFQPNTPDLNGRLKAMQQMGVKWGRQDFTWRRIEKQPGIYNWEPYDRLMEACRAYGWPLPRLVLEPGRYLSAQAGVALYTLGTHKTLADGTRVAAVDGGISDNPRPALYRARYQACLADRPLAEPAQRVRLVGKFCESGDVLIPEVELPPFQRGDRIVLPVAGAYQLSMASNYNLAPRPAVLWLETGEVQVLQMREDLAGSGWWNP